MTGFLDELQAAVTAAAERVGPAVIGLGRGWGRGSGVVIAERPRAHQRARAARRGGRGPAAGRRVRARPRRRASTPTSTSPSSRSTRATRRPSCGIPRSSTAVRPGQPVFALADPGGRGLRTTFGLVTATGRSFRGPRGRRIGGSIEHSAPLPRGSSGGPLVDARGPAAGDQLRAHGGRPAARAAGRRRAARAGRRARTRRGAGAAAARRRARPAARRPQAPRRRRAPRARGPAGARRGSRTARPTPPACSGAICSSPRAAARCTASTSCSTRSTPAAARWSSTVVRGTEEREVIAHFS